MSRNNPRLYFGGMIAPSRVRVATLPEEVSFEVQETCEACGRTLQVLARLHTTLGRSVRIGVCDYCGYTGYIDKPVKEWVVNFYAQDWDKVSPRSVEDIRNNTSLIGGKKHGSRLTAFEVYKKLPVNTSRPVLDIGSGYGQVLKNFYDAGFKHVFGVENSGHRAKRVHEAFGFTIYEGDFGNKELSSTLREVGPFGLIFSHHVLEHTYHPEEVIAEISSLQEDGDALILALPSNGEHILYQALYLPHLHTFTPESLEILLNKYGYEVVVNNTEHETSIILGAVKKQNPVQKLVLKPGYFDEKLARLMQILRFDEVKQGDWYELLWEQRDGDTDFSIKVKTIDMPEMFARLLWNMRTFYWYVRAKIFKRFGRGYRLRLRRLEDGDQEGVIIEYDKNLQLMLK